MLKYFLYFMEDCIFCKIVKGEIPCSKVYEDENFLAFLDISPVNKGHVLVVPKEHSENIFDSDNDVLRKIGPVLKKVSIAVKKGVDADGIVISQNNGKDAGQAVMHLHFHIMPRFKEDGLRHWPGEQDKYSDEEMKELSEKIKEKIN